MRHNPLIRLLFERTSQHLYLRLDLFKQRLELVHIRLLRRPADTKAFLRVGLGDLEKAADVSGSLQILKGWSEQTMWKCTCSSHQLADRSDKASMGSH